MGSKFNASTADMDGTPCDEKIIVVVAGIDQNSRVVNIMKEERKAVIDQMHRIKSNHYK